MDTAICTGERSMMAGMMKLDSSRSSTTLQGMRAALAAADDGGIHGAIVGGGDDQPHAVDVAPRRTRARDA